VRRGALLGVAALCAPCAAPAARAQAAHVVVVAGAGGEPRYADAFHAAARAIAGAARTRYGVPAAHVAYLGENPARAPGEIAAKSTRENVVRAIAAAGRRAAPATSSGWCSWGTGAGRARRRGSTCPGPT
jgi:hypothetical protein